MTGTRDSIHPQPGGIAAIANVALCQRALERAMSRDQHLPGITAFYGPSGLGKSLATTYAGNQNKAYHVEARSYWTPKALLQSILREMGIRATKTIYEMADQVAEQLALSSRPLIIDEFDHLVKKKSVEVVRDLHEASGGCAILIVGEEDLEKKLRQWDRFHNRVLEWTPAVPSSLDDGRLLARLYSPDVEIADDLLERILKVSRQVTRRICINIARVHRHGFDEGMDVITAADWGDRQLDSGEAPARRI